MSDISGTRIKLMHSVLGTISLTLYAGLERNAKKSDNVSPHTHTHTHTQTHTHIQSVSGGIVNILGGGRMDYSE